MKKQRKDNKDTDRLLELYFSGRLDDQSREIVQGWLLSGGNPEKIDAGMVALFAKLVKPSRKPDRYTRRSLAVLQKELGFTGAGTRTVQMRRAVFGIAAGAAAAAAVFLAAVFLLPSFPGTGQPDAVAEIIVTTQPDSVKTVTLPDGSVVELRGATTIAHNADFASDRKVRLDGEACFTIVRDEQHPFTVTSDGVEVTVLGTVFNMRAFETDDWAEVILASGKVKIVSGDTGVTLNPSERATINKPGNEIKLDEADKGSLLRIRGMKLSLEDISLAEAFRRIGGYYRVAIVADENISRIDGIVVKLNDGASLEEALYLLRAVAPVFDYRIEGAEIVLTAGK